MRKLWIILLVTIVLAVTAMDVVAGGDKVRGEKGVGAVYQHQESGLPYEYRPGPQP